MTSGPTKQFPLYLPNTPRESPPIEFGQYFQTSTASAVLDLLTVARRTVLRSLHNHANRREEADVEKDVKDYLALLLGLIAENNSTASQGCNFTWSNLTTKTESSGSGDIHFEIAQIMLSFGIWYLMFGKDLASKDEENASKEGYQKFCKAAGLFEACMQRRFNEASGGSDLTYSLCRGLGYLAIAEAQSLLVVGSEGKRSNSLLASLSNVAANRFDSALTEFKTVNSSLHPKLNQYLLFKSKYFETLAYYFQGLALSEADEPEAGRAIRNLREAISLAQKTKALFDQFLQAQPKAPGKEGVESLEKLSEELENSVSRITKFNDTVYYQNIPPVPDQIPLGNAIAAPAEYQLPPLNEAVWTPDVLRSIQSVKAVTLQANENRQVHCFGLCGGRPPANQEVEMAKSAHFDKTAKIVIVGGGPSGIHMAYLLKKNGFVNVVVLEKENSIGGKSNSIYHEEIGMHIPFEIESFISGATFPLANDLIDKFNIGDASKIPTSGERSIKVLSPSIQKQLGGNPEKILEFKEWVLATTATSRGVIGRRLPTFFQEMKLMSDAKKYERLHKQIFGDYKTAIPPKPAAEHLKSIDCSILEWLKSNDLLGLRAIFEFNHPMLGYGSLEDASAYDALNWTTPQTIFDSIKVKDPRRILKEGYRQLWRGIAERENLNVQLETEVIKIDRKLSARDEPIIVETISHGTPLNFEADFLILGCPLDDVVNNVLVDAATDEKDLFGNIEHRGLISSVVETSTIPTDWKFAFANMDHLAQNSGLAYLMYDPLVGNFPEVKPPTNRKLLVTYQYYPNYSPDRSRDAEQQLLQQFQGMGWQDIKILNQYIPKYYPHFSAQQIQNGAPWKIMEMQGTHRTWYIGGLPSFESIESILAYNIDIVRKYLGITDP